MTYHKHLFLFHNRRNAVNTLMLAVAAFGGLFAFVKPSFAQTQATLHQIYSLPTSGTNGEDPENALVQGNDGNFYGTSARGGANNEGTIFKVTTNGMMTTLVSFNGNNGDAPNGGLILGTGNLYGFYGTTTGGGANNDGTVFNMTPSGALTTLVSFNGTDGSSPWSVLVLGSDGNFYGTALTGGGGGVGTVFKMTPSGTMTPLASFYGTNGANPEAALVQGTDGKFYGTTYNGGASGVGTVFSITTNGTLTTLVSFSGTDGANPFAGLVLGNDGDFYGTTEHGGTNGSGYGTVFKITTDGTLTTIASFNGNNGAKPEAPLVQGTDGNFYGTALLDGASGDGTIFKMTPSGELTTLISFNGANGAYPFSALVQGNDGNFYGTTTGGGADGYGTIFGLTVMLPAVGSLQVTLSPAGVVNAGAQWQVDGGAWQNSGTTLAGLAVGSHAVGFSSIAGWVTPTSQTVTVNSNQTTTATGIYAVQEIIFHQLYSFPTSGANGAGPHGLVQGNDGNFYGTTEYGGGNNGGTVFRIATNGTLTTLTSFNGNNGVYPDAALIQGNDGNFYGTTYNGGSANSFGTIFKMTANGTLTTLVAFNGINGANPPGALIQGADENFYGVTYNGGTNVEIGTTFEMTTNGTLTTLVTFDGTNGANPFYGLVQGSDGNFYGTTRNGGSQGNGLVFKVTNGAFVALHSFSATDSSGRNSDGANPFAALVQGSDGNFYGTTLAGGVDGGGTAFEMTPGGTLTTLVSFNGANGAQPYCILTQGNDGNFYGTTAGGGANGDGTIFTMTQSGQLTTLVSFNGTNGSTPFCGLVQGSDGNFYGTTWTGGAGGNGTAFSFSPPLLFHPLIRTGQSLTLAWNTVAGQVYQLQYTTNLEQVSWNNLGYPLVATNGVITVTDKVGPDTQRFYQVVQSQ